MTQSTTETKDPLIGQSIDHGRYELLRVIGEGGMGKVYEARQKRVDRLVAVKVLHSHWAKDPKLVARFKREALTASQFRHPNTVMIYDYGETINGDLYIIMELLKGQSLLSLLDKEGPLSLERALKIIDQVCGAVTEVHRCGVIHRDLKPENIQIDPRDGHPDFVKLLDFSIAKLVNDNTLSSMDTKQNLTLQGAVFGTPQYMSPEQVRGRTLDQRTDLYAIGVIFYQMLSGFVPFSEATPQGTMMSHLTEPVPRFEEKVPHLDIHPSAAQIIYDCLEKNPTDRIESSDALTQRLMELKYTLQREEELNAEPDTDLGTPQVTSRLTSATRDELNTEEQSVPPSPRSATDLIGKSQTDESLPHLEDQQTLGKKEKKLVSALGRPKTEETKEKKLFSSLGKNKTIEPPKWPVKINRQTPAESHQTHALESDNEKHHPATEETQEFNPALHGTIEGESLAEKSLIKDSKAPSNSEPTPGPSITSAVTMGVEELAEYDQDSALSHLIKPSPTQSQEQEKHDELNSDVHDALKDPSKSSSHSIPSELNVDNQSSVKASSDHLKEKDSVILHKDQAQSTNIKRSFDSEQTTQNSEQTTQNSEQTTQSSEQTTQSSEQTTQSSEQTTQNSEQTTQNSEQTTQNSEQTTQNAANISNTDALHTIDIIEDTASSSVDSTTQELRKVKSQEASETLPIYGLQASELINVINDESVANSTIDSEQVSTGLFEPVKAKRQYGLSIALVSAIALIVFVTLNPHLLQKLNASLSTPPPPAKKIKLGSAQLELSYHLTAKPKGLVYNRLSGKLLGETPLIWKKSDPQFAKGLFEVRAEGYTSQIVSLAGFTISANDPKTRELHLQLKPVGIEVKSTNVALDKQANLDKNKQGDEGKIRLKKKKTKKPSKSRKSRPKSKHTTRTRKIKKQSKQVTLKAGSVKQSVVKSKQSTIKNNQSVKETTPSSSPSKKKVPELPKLSPNDPVDPARFKDPIEIQKLP